MLKGKKRLLIAGCALIAIAVMLITYVVLIGFGVINVRPNTLVIRAGTAEKPYDGEALVCEEWFIEHGEVKSGHTLIPLFSGSQTNPGQSANQVTVRIVDANNVDVTDEYHIEYLAGTLSVYNPQLKITSSDFSKEFDGTPLTAPDDGWFLESGTLMMGHRIQVTMTGSQTMAGSSDSTFRALILTEDGKDVTENYSMEIVCGKLEVLPRSVTITTASAAWTYDGTPLTAHSFQMDRGTLVEGHQINCEYTASRTTVGTCENTMTATVTDAEGNDVSSNYTLDITCGTLEVLPRPVTIRSASAKMKYDGNPLTAHSAVVEQGTLVGGHRLQCEFSGSQTQLGISENFFTVDIVDAEGTSVIENYELTTLTGVLAVVEFVPHDDPDASAPVTSPENNSSINGGVPDGSTEVLALQSSVAGPVYLRLQHFGDYNTDNFGWDQAPSLTEEVCGTNPLYWLSSALLQSGEELSSMSITWLVDSRGLLTPYYSQTNYATGVDDSYIPDGRWDYVVERYSVDVLDTLTGRTSSLTLPAELQASEAAYREYVYRHYLQMPGTEVDAEIWKHIKGKISPGSVTLIQDVAAYVREVASYNLAAEPAPDGIDPIIFFLETKEGVCRHYASTAVLMYRALGVPARYVVGYMANLSENQLVTITNMQAHAWVEVYVDGLGWIPVEVTGGSGSGNGGANGSGNGAGTGSGSGSISSSDRIPLIVRPETVYGVTNGTEYRPTAYRLVGDLAENHEFVCTYGGSLIEAGTVASYIASYQILDQNTKEDVSYLYEVTLLEGVIHVVNKSTDLDGLEKPVWMVIKPVDAEQIYNGEALRADAWEYLTNSGELKEGHTLECVFGGELTSPGDGESYIESYRIVDANGNDVTSRYEVTCLMGSLKVWPSDCYLTIRPKDVLGVPDGQTWIATEWEYTEDSIDRLMSGHVLTCVFEGSRVLAGESMSIIVSYTVVDSEGKDVTDYYNVVTKHGRILVQIPITIKPVDVEGIENGEYWRATEWEYTAGTLNQLMPGHELSATYFGFLTTGGTTNSYISEYTILDEQGMDVTDTYRVNTEVGRIKVRIPLTIKPRDVYGFPDGRVWTATEWEYTADNTGRLKVENILTCVYEGTLQDIGETTTSIVSYVIHDKWGTDVTDDYVVTTELGKIQLNTKIIIRPQTVFGIVDGSVWKAFAWEYVPDTVNTLLPDHTMHCEFVGSRSMAGVTESHILSYRILDADGMDVTEQYIVETMPGVIKVRIPITIKPVDVEGYADGREWRATDWEYAAGTAYYLTDGCILHCFYDGSMYTAGEADSSILNYWIEDANGFDVTDDYSVQTELGRIRVKEYLIIKPVDVVGVEDGREWYATDWEFAPGNNGLLQHNHTLYCQYEGSFSVVGDFNSTITEYVILDDMGVDVTNQYVITTEPGLIRVQMPLYIKPQDVFGFLNGEEWFATDWEYTGDSTARLMEGHRLVYEIAGSLSTVGTAESTIVSYTILDEQDRDVMEYYCVFLKPGEIRVQPLLAIKPADVYGVADGTEWIATAWEHNDVWSALLPGHELYCEFEGLRVEAGSTFSSIVSYIVRDELGNDVTDSYYVMTFEGLIKVRIPMTIKPVDVVGYDNGTEWSAAEPELVAGMLLGGHRIEAQFDGYRMEVGESISTILGYVIYNDQGEDVTDDYFVTTQPGVIQVKRYLSILPEYVEGIVNGQTWVADDWAYAYDSGELLPGHTLHCEFYGSLSTEGRTESRIESYTILDAYGQDVTDSYFVVIHTGAIKVRIPMTIKPVDVVGLFDGVTAWSATAWEYTTDTLGQLLPGHTMLCEFEGSAIEIGVYDASYISSIIILDENGEDVSDRYEVSLRTGKITVQSQIVIKPKDQQVLYDGNLHGATDWEYVSGSAQLPAHHQLVDVTYGGAVKFPVWPDDSITDDAAYFEASKQYTFITGYRIVDVNNGDDVTAQYDIVCSQGYIVIQSLDIEVTPSNYQAKYDGLNHVASRYTVKATSAVNGSTAWLSNYSVEVKLSGSRVDYGKTTITVASVTVYDANGIDVTAAFGIEKKTATMHIYADMLAFETGSASKTYDGLALTNSDYSLLSGTLLDGHSLSVTMNSKITNVGSATNTPTVSIRDAYGADVTDWYYINDSQSHYGTLTVAKAKLTVTSGSATAPYNPDQALTCHDFTVEGQLASGETVTVVITGSQLRPGKSENFLSWKDIKVKRNGVDTTSNYEIEVKTGWLLVTPN